jgi:hypothetical protein
LNGRVVTDPERSDVVWSYVFRDGLLQLTREEPGRIERFVLEYAFGSGHNATTFVTLTDPRIPSAREHRLTFYSAGERLGISPGQDQDDHQPGTTASGRDLSPRETRKCFRCHSTQISARGDQEIDERTLMPNVSCEQCHGPGRSHVAAARRLSLESELAMPFGLDGWTAESLLQLCGQCHRHPSRAQPEQIRADDPHLARFQPIGIMQSRCYQESGGSFQCLTCHDPHSRVSSDRDAYNAACLGCHHGPDLPKRPGNERSATGTVCPISPQTGCINCHMPRVECGQNILFADHWIRVPREAEPLDRVRATSRNRAPVDRD